MYACLQELLFILLLSCAFGAAGVLGGLTVSEWDDNYIKNPAYIQYEHTLMAMKRYSVATTVSFKKKKKVIALEVLPLWISFAQSLL